MITPEAARATILERVQPLPARTVPLAQAIQCFAAEAVVARWPLPAFNNSAMDGYAVVASSTRDGARLKIIGEQPAGLDRALVLQPGEAVRIFTGAPLPRGADAVVMQEETTVKGDEVQLQTRVEPGEFVRRKGNDVAAGQMILAAGTRVLPQTLALLAAQGLAALAVGGQPRVAIISTGDELAQPGMPLQPGQIYESNSLLLEALVRQAGAEVVSREHCADDGEVIRARLSAALRHEVVILSGGVSVGARDLVKPVLSALGVALDLWRVAVKPGKPFLFGRKDGCLIFGLPGNPVSAFVTYLLFVRPALLKLMGATGDELELPQSRALLAEEVENRGDRPHYLRGALREGEFRPMGRQESHALFGLSRANALLLLRPNESLPAGASVTVLTWA